MLAACWCFYRHCPLFFFFSVLLMADMQPLQKCLVLALCHNLHCIHVGSCWCLFWVCLCPWVCHWLFRGFEPWLIGRLVCTVQIRCTAGIDGRVPDCMLFISSMRRDRSEGNGTALSAYNFISKFAICSSYVFVLEGNILVNYNFSKFLNAFKYYIIFCYIISASLGLTLIFWQADLHRTCPRIIAF